MIDARTLIDLIREADSLEQLRDDVEQLGTKPEGTTMNIFDEFIARCANDCISGDDAHDCRTCGKLTTRARICEHCADTLRGWMDECDEVGLGQLRHVRLRAVERGGLWAAVGLEDMRQLIAEVSC